MRRELPAHHRRLSPRWRLAPLEPIDGVLGIFLDGELVQAIDDEHEVTDYLRVRLRWTSPPQ